MNQVFKWLLHPLTQFRKWHYIHSKAKKSIKLFNEIKTYVDLNRVTQHKIFDDGLTTHMVYDYSNGSGWWFVVDSRTMELTAALSING